MHVLKLCTQTEAKVNPSYQMYGNYDPRVTVCLNINGIVAYDSLHKFNLTISRS